MKKFFTFALAAFAAMSMFAAGTPVASLNFEIKTGDTDVPTSWTYSSEKAPSIKVQDGITCIIISDGGQSTAPTFNDPEAPSGGKRWMAFCPDNDCDAVFSIYSNKKAFSVVNKDGVVKEYTNTAKAIEDVEVKGLKKDTWYALCGGSSQVYITKAVFTASCEAPAEPLTFTASKTSEIYEGDEITFSSTGGNSGDKAITLDGNAFTADKWMAEAGEHTFVMTQDVKDGKCGATIEIKLTVATKAPVSKAEIEGSKTAIINKEVTLTCKAENATNFQWYKGSDKIDGATAAEYKFTPTEAGELSFSCEAWNKFTDPHIKSNAFTITVAESECGKLITFNVKTGSDSFDKDFTIDKDQDNVIGGTAHQKTDKNGKINKDGAYISLKLAEGSFAAGDVVTIVASNVNNCTNGYETTLYSDAGVTLIGKAPFDEAKTATIKLQGAAETIYLYRLNFAVDSMNPTVSSMSVRRPCGSESSDASIKSLSMNGNVIEAKDKLYAFEVAADYDSANPVEIKFELNDSKAKADHESPFKLLAPEKSSDTIRAEINVTAEDFTKAQYKIEITRAEAPKSNDASIKELKINNEVVAEKEGIFAYEVAAEAALDSVEVSFTLADKAVADPASPFKVLVPEAEAPASEKTIKVTAEDGTTTKEYKVSVTKAKKAEEGLDNVTDSVKVVKYFENGQLVIIKNGVKYNAQGAIMK